MKIPRKVVIAGVASVLVAGMAGASAASLGVLGGGSLGSADSVVASCDSNGINLTYTTEYDFTNGQTEVTGVTLSGVDDQCDGQTATLTLRSATSALGGAQVLAVPSATGVTSFTIPVANGVSAEEVVGVSLVIQG
jgi:hypothetical protein